MDNRSSATGLWALWCQTRRASCDQTRAGQRARRGAGGQVGRPTAAGGRAMDPHHAFRPCPALPAFQSEQSQDASYRALWRPLFPVRAEERRERDWTLWLYCPPRLSQSAPRSLALLPPSIPIPCLSRPLWLSRERAGAGGDPGFQITRGNNDDDDRSEAFSNRPGQSNPSGVPIKSNRLTSPQLITSRRQD